MADTNTDNANLTSQIITIVLAIVIVGVVMIPIINGLTNSGNSNDGETGDDDVSSGPVTVFNEGVYYKEILDEDHTITLSKQGTSFTVDVDGVSITLDMTYSQNATESRMILYNSEGGLFVKNDGEVIYVGLDNETYTFQQHVIRDLSDGSLVINLIGGEYTITDRDNNEYDGEANAYLYESGEFVYAQHAKVECAEPIDINSDNFSYIPSGVVMIGAIYPNYPVAVEGGQTVYKDLYVMGGGYAIDTIGITSYEGSTFYNTLNVVAFDDEGTQYGNPNQDGGNPTTMDVVYGDHYFTINGLTADLGMPSPMAITEFLAPSSITYESSEKCVIDSNIGIYYQNADKFSSNHTFTVSLNGSNIIYTIDNTTVIDTGLDYSPNVSEDTAEFITLMYGRWGSDVIVDVTGNVRVGGDVCGNVHDGSITFTGGVVYGDEYRVNYYDSVYEMDTHITISKYMDVNGPWCYCKTAKFTTTPITANFNLNFGQRNTVFDHDFGTILGKNVGSRTVYTQVSGNSIEAILDGTAYSKIEINLESLDLGYDISAYTLNYTEGDYYTLTSVTFDVYFNDTNTNQEEIVQYTADGFLVPTQVMYFTANSGGGGNTDPDNGDNQMVNTILTLIPVFVIIGIIGSFVIPMISNKID